MLTRFDAIMGQQLRENRFNHITPEIIIFALEHYAAQIEEVKRRARAEPGLQFSYNFHITHHEIIRAQERPRHLDVLYDHMHFRPEWLVYHEGANSSYADRARAEAKSIELLKSWLDPTQLRDYKSHRHFTVRGSDTGKFYRLVGERSYNILELGGSSMEPNGNKFCVVPRDSVAMGDQLLAQKIWLETDEARTLAIANKVARGGNGQLLQHITREVIEMFQNSNVFLRNLRDHE
jgi:hypothetical protein